MLVWKLQKKRTLVTGHLSTFMYKKRCDIGCGNGTIKCLSGNCKRKGYLQWDVYEGQDTSPLVVL
eukprot:5644259-Ditylum_brightwellii.AAC.1